MSLDDMRPHYVYELWAEDRCLYVGMTVNANRRVGDHRRTKPWWPRVTEVRTTECNGWRAAADLEAHTILRLRPEMNLQWNPDYDKSLLQRPGVAELLACTAAP